MERKGDSPSNGGGETFKTEERDGVKLELSTRGMEKQTPEVKQDIPVMARFLSDDFTEKDWKKMEGSQRKKRKPVPQVLKVCLFLTIVTAVLMGIFFYLSKMRKTPVPQNTEAELSSSTPAAAVSENDLKAKGTAIVLSIDNDSKKIRFKEPETGEEYLLNMTDSTVYEDRAGNPMVAAQLKPGDIADILVSVHSSTLSTVHINNDQDLFEFVDITDYDISKNKGIFSYDGNNYKLLKGTVVMAGDEPFSLKEIKDGDILTVKGKGKDIYVIKETGGNGYVRVTGAESFKGGWIELGSVIRPIEDEMIFTVPEGNYVMKVTYHHYGGNKNVSVKRGRETRVDVSDLKGDLLKTGFITFAFDPVEANPEVRVDGKMIIKENPLELDYGVHTLDIKAEGYIDIHKYLKVGEPMANLTIVLEKDEEEKKETTSKNSSDKKDTAKKSDPIPKDALPETFKTTGSSSSNPDAEKTEEKENTEPDDTETVTTDVGQLYIDGPEGTEVYYDGAYKGIAPCHFTKNGGTHVITLIKDGYETKSYTLNLSSGTENESYSFNELVEEEHDA